MKYAFVSLPAHGHINPTLGVVWALRARGHQVLYYATEDFHTLIEAAGADFYAYRSTFEDLKPRGTRTAGAPAPGAPHHRPPPRGPLLGMVDEARAVVPQILEHLRAQRPDVLLYDLYCLWARVAARILDIPAIPLCTSYATSDDVNPFAAQGTRVERSLRPLSGVTDGLNEMCHAYGVEPFPMADLLWGADPFVLVFIAREFQPQGERFDERYVFVGPSILPRLDASGFPLELLLDRKVVFVSLGTVSSGQAAFFNACFEAFAGGPWLVVLSHGPHVDSRALHRTPGNFLVAPFVPQLEILRHTSVFVSHGGPNSAMESLYYDVPMVVVPQTLEHGVTARRVQELGVGLALAPQDAGPEALRSTVERVMTEPRYRSRAREMGEHVRAAGGYRRAVEVVERYGRSLSRASTGRT